MHHAKIKPAKRVILLRSDIATCVAVIFLACARGILLCSYNILADARVKSKADALGCIDFAGIRKEQDSYE